MTSPNRFHGTDDDFFTDEELAARVWPMPTESFACHARGCDFVRLFDAACSCRPRPSRGEDER